LDGLGSAIERVRLEVIRGLVEQEYRHRTTFNMLVGALDHSQALIQEMLNEIDPAERAELDPERHARLRLLGELTRRLHRQNANALAASGIDQFTQTSKPVRLAVAVRAAQSATREASRVAIEDTELECWLLGRPAAAIVSLLVELLDNAADFSFPRSSVRVQASRSADDVIVTIADRGPEITHDRLADLNRQIAVLSLPVRKSSGLPLVSCLAHRWGVQVRLNSTSDGTTATVTLPSHVLFWGGRAGQDQA